MRSSVSVGVVGTGIMGRRLASQIDSVPGAAVTALVDGSPDAAEDVATRLGIEPTHVYTGYEAMYDDEPLDAVVVATPHCFHYEQIAAALDRNYDVLTEKPLVTDLEEARRLAEKHADAVVMVGYQRRVQSVFQRVRERYRGSGPEIRYVDATLVEHWLELSEGTWRTDYEYSGGGFVTDAVRHLIDAILWVTGLDPVAVDATMEFHRDRIEKRGTVTVHLENGAKATITGFGDARTHREEYLFCDDDGTVRIEGHGWDEDERKSLEVTDGDSWNRTEPHLEQRTDPGKGEVFIECVRDGRTPPATIESSVRVIELVQAARTAAETGETVRLSDPGDDG